MTDYMLLDEINPFLFKLLLVISLYHNIRTLIKTPLMSEVGGHTHLVPTKTSSQMTRSGGSPVLNLRQSLPPPPYLPTPEPVPPDTG